MYLETQEPRASKTSVWRSSCRNAQTILVDPLADERTWPGFNHQRRPLWIPLAILSDVSHASANYCATSQTSQRYGSDAPKTAGEDRAEQSNGAVRRLNGNSYGLKLMRRFLDEALFCLRYRWIPFHIEPASVGGALSQLPRLLSRIARKALRVRSDLRKNCRTVCEGPSKLKASGSQIE